METKASLPGNQACSYHGNETSRTNIRQFVFKLKENKSAQKYCMQLNNAILFCQRSSGQHASTSLHHCSCCIPTPHGEITCLCNQTTCLCNGLQHTYGLFVLHTCMNCVGHNTYLYSMPWMQSLCPMHTRDGCLSACTKASWPWSLSFETSRESYLPLLCGNRNAYLPLWEVTAPYEYGILASDKRTRCREALMLQLTWLCRLSTLAHLHVLAYDLTFHAAGAPACLLYCVCPCNKLGDEVPETDACIPHLHHPIYYIPSS